MTSFSKPQLSAAKDLILAAHEALPAARKLAQTNPWSSPIAMERVCAYQHERGWGTCCVFSFENGESRWIYPSEATRFSPERLESLHASAKTLCAARDDGLGYEALRECLVSLGFNPAGPLGDESASSDLFELPPKSALYSALGEIEPMSLAKIADFLRPRFASKNPAQTPSPKT